MRYFLASGEPSGELSAVLLAREIAQVDSQARFEGIGGERMRAEGIDLWRHFEGWASVGPLAAIPKLPAMAVRLLAAARHIATTKPDLVVLVDFGAFNVRLAKLLRGRFGYTKPILDVFPPGTWLDDERKARDVAAHVVPLTAFEHQYQFYKSHQLPIVYFGHPLAAQYRMRAARPPAPADGGVLALLPGSRAGELRAHVPVLLDAVAHLQKTRPRLIAVAGAAHARARAFLTDAIASRNARGVDVVDGLQNAIAAADAALCASGTAVLEVALSGVPVAALYIIAKALEKHARRVMARSGPYITLPNLVLRRNVVPELLQDHASGRNLALAADALLADPSSQLAAFEELRERLGPPDALQRCARFAFALAKAGGA